jgi:hypothetical protein
MDSFQQFAKARRKLAEVSYITGWVVWRKWRASSAMERLQLPMIGNMNLRKIEENMAGRNKVPQQ